ncbi:MAG: hypothetical protein M3430_19235 [Acidobacteriota bacterium]|nr:hypothetical protein [Acidobacteriota bacterium]
MDNLNETLHDERRGKTFLPQMWSSRRALDLRFKLFSTLPANAPGTEVERATRKVYIGSLNTTGKLDVYAVSAAWDVSSITTNNVPALGSLVTTTAQITTVPVNSAKEQQTQIEQFAGQNNRLQEQVDALKEIICQTNAQADVLHITRK